VETGGNWTLAGDPGTLDPATVAGRVAGRAGLRDGLDRQHLGRPRGTGRQWHGWGAFSGGRLVAVSCPFFVGAAYEDLGVATEPGFRGLGLSTACAAAVCQDVRGRGRVPSWTTSPDNTASLRVAAKLGFRLQRHDRLLAADVPIPEPAVPPPQP
jgi:RimJ/RimL family protein N-acetyltransferase